MNRSTNHCTTASQQREREGKLCVEERVAFLRCGVQEEEEGGGVKAEMRKRSVQLLAVLAKLTVTRRFASTKL